ncbi:hypothetical protein DFH09DRAFT_552353 [Mycena vulgaris]|nr:hypothetical protein DFH09DRAFT_552353 [Mycena vulgaris]
MSSDKVNGSDAAKSNSDPNHAQMTASIEADIAELSELLSKDTLDDAGEASVAELLARLESADGVAKGVESKLDSLLGNLDSLLASLEKSDDLVQSDSNAPASESQSTDEKAK